MRPDLSVELAGVKLRAPIVQASGGPYTKDGRSIAKTALAGAAAVTTKSIQPKAAKVGRPCMIKTSVGLLNCEEWAELDYEDWINVEIAEAKKGGVPIIASVFDEDPENLARMCVGVAEAGADILEVSGGYNSELLPTVVGAVKKRVKDVPIMGKICPPVADIAALGKSTERAGADAFSAMDTLGPCYMIDIETGRVVGGRGSGELRLSGAAIKPLTVYQVATLARVVKIPILGIGGVSNGNDAIEMMMAGATAVGICTATLLKGLGVFKEMEEQIARYMERKGVRDLSEIRGLALKDLEHRERTNFAMYEARPPVIHAERCTGCMICVRVCGYEAIKVQNKTPKADKEKCYGCGLCISSCPTAALTTPY